MPREVFAEEIEAFLERLEGVVSARVVASLDGEIERIYLTAEGHMEVAEVRRAVTSALMSRFSLPLDGLRIRIARLRDEPAPLAERAAYRLQRFTETLTEAQAQAFVELRYEVNGETRAISGSTKGPPGREMRLRTIAQATVNALRTTLSAEERSLAVEAVTVLPFASKEVALVALSYPSREGQEVLVGAALVETSIGEAVVNATIEAASKRVVRAVRSREGMGPMDRRERLEAMRRYYQRVLKGPMRFQGTSLAPEEPEGREERAVVTEMGSDNEIEDVPVPSEVSGFGPRASGPSEAHGLRFSVPSPLEPSDLRFSVPGPSEDTISDISDIRPEKEGGASMTTRDMSERREPQSIKQSLRSSFEDAFYQRLVDTANPVYIRCVDGYEIRNAVFKGYGTYAVLVEVGGVEELLFKHGIISVRPEGPLPPKEVGEA